MGKFICLDIGGTSIKYGVMEEKEGFIDRGIIASEAENGALHMLRKAEDIISKYAKGCMDGLCISTAGVVEPTTGIILHSNTNIPGYIGINLKAYFYNKFGIPCEVENDVNCAGLAEAVSGAAAGRKIAFCMTVGTGIGGCLLMNGRVIHGSCNCAGEVGYMQLREGNLEPAGTVKSLVQNVIRGKGQSDEKWDGKKVLDYAGKGDTICLTALEKMARILGMGIANICYCLNPEVVVLGGGIMSEEYESLIYPRIRKIMDEHLPPLIAKNTQLKMASHRNEAGMLGAYYHFLQMRGTKRLV